MQSTNDDHRTPPVPTARDMRVAELLSDLTSLRACDPEAALALVSARPDTDEKGSRGEDGGGTEEGQEDPDLKRARELLILHSAVKLRHGMGVDDEVLAARKEVDKVMAQLGK